MGYPWKWEILTDFWPSKGIYSHHNITCKILPIMTYGWRLWFNETSYCKVGNQLATCEITILISRDLPNSGEILLKLLPLLTVVRQSLAHSAISGLGTGASSWNGGGWKETCPQQVVQLLRVGWWTPNAGCFQEGMWFTSHISKEDSGEQHFVEIICSLVLPMNCKAYSSGVWGRMLLWSITSLLLFASHCRSMKMS